ncbi:MAG: 30S ribosomal protein S8, partial [Maioricimonas sp. JB045]
MMTDPIADMLTRIRNAVHIERPFVDIPVSKVKIGIAETLQREGYIWDFEVIEQEPQGILRINLKYGPNGERVIQKIDRVSKPGRRVYSGSEDIPEVLQGLGITILSTNQGV